MEYQSGLLVVRKLSSLSSYIGLIRHLHQNQLKKERKHELKPSFLLTVPFQFEPTFYSTYTCLNHSELSRFTICPDFGMLDNSRKSIYLIPYSRVSKDFTTLESYHGSNSFIILVSIKCFFDTALNHYMTLKLFQMKNQYTFTWLLRSVLLPKIHCV